MRPIVFLGNYRALTRTVAGHKMIVDTRDLSLGCHILLDGIWEPWVTQVIQATVRPGWIVVEIGANIGYYTLLMASLIGSQGKIYAFEPNPAIYELLRENLEINGFLDRAIAVKKAVWEKSGTVEFGIASKHMGGSGIFTFSTPDEPVERITVEAVSLDDYFPAGSRVDFLKIDAESSEFFILKGAQRLLRENPDLVMVLEFFPGNIRNINLDPEQCLKWLVDEGFQIHRIEENGNVRRAAIHELLDLNYSELLIRR